MAYGAMIDTGVCLAMRVTVERRRRWRSGRALPRGTRIGTGSVVGAASVVLYTVPEGVQAYNAPARVIRKIGPRD